MYVLFPETNAAETTAQDSIFLFAERLHAAVGRLDLADQPFGAHLFQTIPVTVGLVSLVEVLRVPAFFRAERKAVMDECTYRVCIIPVLIHKSLGAFRNREGVVRGRVMHYPVQSPDAGSYDQVFLFQQLVQQKRVLLFKRDAIGENKRAHSAVERIRGVGGLVVRHPVQREYKVDAGLDHNVVLIPATGRDTVSAGAGFQDMNGLDAVLFVFAGQVRAGIAQLLCVPVITALAQRKVGDLVWRKHFCQ